MSIWKKYPRTSGLWYNDDKVVISIYNQYKVNDIVGARVEITKYKLKGQPKTVRKFKTRSAALKYAKAYMKKN